MADFFVVGKKRNGKTLIAVSRIRAYLLQGKPVATNVDLNLEFLLGDMAPTFAQKKNERTGEMEKVLVKPLVYRLPDKPSVRDLDLIGRGSDVPNDETYGLIVLDECGLWMNARGWQQDKERKALLDWLAHSGKRGWDVYYLVHDLDSIDSQIRKSFCEHLVICRRLDRIRIPVIGPLLGVLGITAVLPKVHIATVRYGDYERAPITDRWWYTGKDLYSSYDTRQGFKDQAIWSYDADVQVPGRQRYSEDDPYIMHRDRENRQVLVDMRATCTMLPPVYVTGTLAERVAVEKMGHYAQLIAMRQRLHLQVTSLRQMKKDLFAGKRIQLGGNRRRASHFSGSEELPDYRSVRQKSSLKDKTLVYASRVISILAMSAVIYFFWGGTSKKLGAQAANIAGNAQHTQAPALASTPAPNPQTPAPNNQNSQAPVSFDGPAKPQDKQYLDTVESMLDQYQPYLTGTSLIGQRQTFVITFFDSGLKPVKTMSDRDFKDSGWYYQVSSRTVRVWRDGVMPRYLSLVPVKAPDSNQQQMGVPHK